MFKLKVLNLKAFLRSQANHRALSPRRYIHFGGFVSDFAEEIDRTEPSMAGRARNVAGDAKLPARSGSDAQSATFCVRGDHKCEK